MQVVFRMRGRDTWVLLATIVGSSLVFIDGTVVALALPAIQHAFRTSAGAVAWIVELYTLVLGSLMLLGGSLADRYGRKRVFVTGVALFAAGSVGCAFAWSIESLLAARAFQGFGGMLMAPASLAILGAHFSGDARGRAIGTWSAFGALTAAAGPMLGGLLIDAYGWRSVFWINVPLAAAVIVATLRHVAESRDDDAPRHIDAGGAALVTLGLGAITYAMISASAVGWTIAVNGTLCGGAALLAAFVLWERRAQSPLVPGAIFSSRTFGAINLATLLLYGALSGLFYEVPFAMIQAHGYTALQTALATLPMAISLVLLARVGTALAQRFGTRSVLAAGPWIVACGFALLGLLSSNTVYWFGFFPGILVVGIGMGFTVAPLTTAVVDAANPHHVGIASGINNAVSRVAGLLAIAALTLVLAGAYARAMNRSLDAMHAGAAQRRAAAAQRDRLGGARFTDPGLQRASREAFDRGFGDVAFLCALLAALAGCVDALAIDDAALARRSS